MIANKDDLEFCLRRWGRAFGEAPPEEWDETDVAAPAGENTIATAMEFAPPKVEIDRRLNLHRSSARLRINGAAAGLQTDKGSVAPVPSWAVDPIRAPRQTSSGGGSVWAPDPIAEVVERSALRLYEFDRYMGICLRVEYCVRGKFREKVERAGYYLSVRLTLKLYRTNLDKAKVWMAGRLAI